MTWVQEQDVLRFHSETSLMPVLEFETLIMKTKERAQTESTSFSFFCLPECKSCLYLVFIYFHLLLSTNLYISTDC